MEVEVSVSVTEVMMEDTPALRGPREAWPHLRMDGVTEGFRGTEGEGGWSRLEEHLMRRPGRVRTPERGGRGAGH